MRGQTGDEKNSGLTEDDIEIKVRNRAYLAALKRSGTLDNFDCVKADVTDTEYLDVYEDLNYNLHNAHIAPVTTVLMQKTADGAIIGFCQFSCGALKISDKEHSVVDLNCFALDNRYHGKKLTVTDPADSSVTRPAAIANYFLSHCIDEINRVSDNPFAEFIKLIAVANQLGFYSNYFSDAQVSGKFDPHFKVLVRWTEAGRELRAAKTAAEDGGE
ncbi:MAG: hypothetical protein LBN02_01825 [Oscillospiraceae bacterium]|jgi:hypothetical protein|nr:hypothetical protein [Oscillospiraceae bacterium]